MAPRAKTATTATATAQTASSGRDIVSELAYLTRVLKAPSLAASIDRLAKRARDESWTFEEFLLGTLDFVAAKENVIFLGPPGTGETHLSTGLGIRAC